MLKKPKHYDYDTTQIRQRFSIKKFKFGAASVVIGTFFLFGAAASQPVLAEQAPHLMENQTDNTANNAYNHLTVNDQVSIAEASDRRSLPADVDLNNASHTTYPPELSGNEAAFALGGSYYSDNVHSLGGGVDVTPLAAKESEDDTVEYSYQISLQAIQSSDHIQTGDTFHTAIPGFAKDVKFTQIGTYDKKVLHQPTDVPVELAELGSYGDQSEDNVLSKRMEASRNVEINLGITRQQAAFMQSLKDRAQFLKDKGLSEENIVMSLAWYDEIEERKRVGLDTIPDAIVFTGYTYNHFGSGGQIDAPEDPADLIRYDKKYENIPGTIKNYQYTVLADGHPMALRVSFRVSKEQARKTPNLPLWTALAWRRFHEGGIGSYEDGAQSIYDYAGGRKAAQFVAHPEYISNGQFDKNGMYGTNAGVTGYTGDWRLVGTDVSKGNFNYVDYFDLRSNPAVTYIAPANEDMRDIAVVAYKEPEVITESGPLIEIEKETGFQISGQSGAQTIIEDTKHPDLIIGGQSEVVDIVEDSYPPLTGSSGAQTITEDTKHPDLIIGGQSEVVDIVEDSYPPLTGSSGAQTIIEDTKHPDLIIGGQSEVIDIVEDSYPPLTGSSGAQTIIEESNQLDASSISFPNAHYLRKLPFFKAKQSLPSTGDTSETASLVGLGVVGVIASTPMLISKRKED
ncbi:YSIRK-type signal peptide-containing protein [Streptococcus halichoeri]|uniref:YSIRK-type signal peptide-containing protein n=1 Tax=Streptococcus halichoeri TaxID=254785 RepID=UPI00135C8FE4|nr:YSIRK-type signal peptide-containing protein [Streptococcus halichoeri]